MTDAVETNAEATPVEAPQRKSVKKENQVKGGVLDNVLRSTKVTALLRDLMSTSRTNPYSVNYNPMSAEVQLIDGDGNVLGVKTVVL